jgi:hypothetical protein
MKYFLFLIMLAFAGPVYGAACENRICNPLNDAFSSVPGFVAGLVKVVVILALPIVALALVYAGFLFISARGKGDKLSIAKNNFQYVIIGATLILGAWVFASMLWGTIGQILQGSGGGSSPAPTRGGTIESIRI